MKLAEVKLRVGSDLQVLYKNTCRCIQWMINCLYSNKGKSEIVTAID